MMLNIENNDKNILALIGKNGTGKTFQLEKILNTNNFVIMITGDGAPIISRQINIIKIDDKMENYVYTNEFERGSKSDIRVEKIDNRVKKILNYSRLILGRLTNLKDLSKGQEKLKNIMKVLTEHNLNNIQYILFDEPDTYLDEEYLKIIVELIKKILDANIIVRVATHSSRLLKILNLDISDIMLLNGVYGRVLLSNEIIVENYKKISNEVQKVRQQERIDMTSGIDFKLNLAENKDLLECFIEQNIKDESFYRCLFCSKVFIVEGESDIMALSHIKEEFDSSIGIFCANGKAFIPFFVWLFRSYNKEVIVIIDEDEITQKNAYEITIYLRSLSEIRKISLITHNPDLESYYGIDLDNIANRVDMTNGIKNKNRGWLKIISSYIFFKDNYNMMKLKRHILGDKDNSKYEFS